MEPFSQNRRILLAIVFHMLCSPAIGQNSAVDGTGFSRLTYFEPLIRVVLINDGFRLYGKPDDSLSTLSKNLMRESIRKYSDQIHITDEYETNDTALRSRIEQEELLMFKEATWHPRDITSVKIEPVIDSLLTSTHRRYALLVISTGFVRSKKNYSAQLVDQLSLMVFTLGGGANKLPHKYSSELYLMIVDDLYKNAVYYREAYDPKGNPLDGLELERQLQALFDGRLVSK